MEVATLSIFSEALPFHDVTLCFIYMSSFYLQTEIVNNKSLENVSFSQNIYLLIRPHLLLLSRHTKQSRTHKRKYVITFSIK